MVLKLLFFPAEFTIIFRGQAVLIYPLFKQKTFELAKLSLCLRPFVQKLSDITVSPFSKVCEKPSGASIHPVGGLQTSSLKTKLEKKTPPVSPDRISPLLIPYTPVG